MLGVAGVLGQEILNPSVNWYTEAALPQNLPAPFTNINMGGLLAWEFLLMHWVEVRRWQDIRKHGSVNEVRPLEGDVGSGGGRCCLGREQRRRGGIGSGEVAAPTPPPPPPPTHQDPIFKGNKVPNLEPGYPGGIFDPLGFSKGNLKELQTKEVKNGRLAMVAFIGFVFAVRGLAALGARLRGARRALWA
jgi:light-harvesting complex I chlorophyll a/b binding protein 4